MLEPQQVVSHLLRHHLISEASIIGGDLAITDASGRNRVFMVTRGRGSNYVLKQGASPAGIGSVAHEAAVYRRLHTAPPDVGLAQYLPRYHGYDPDQQVLVLEFVRDAQNLNDYHIHGERFPTNIGRLLGDALGALHSTTTLNATDTAAQDAARPHGVLALHHPELAFVHTISDANMQFVKLLQGSDELCHRLDDLRASWQVSALIHYDLKWENCLVYAMRGHKGARGLKLIDWELAQPGDPCWDIGSVFAAYLSCWFFSLPLRDDAPLAQSLERARYPLEAMQPAIRAFWRAYTQRMRLTPDVAAQWLPRAVAYVAARLLLIQFEQTSYANWLPDDTSTLLQLSLNILRDPAVASEHLLGLAAGPASSV